MIETDKIESIDIDDKDDYDLVGILPRFRLIFYFQLSEYNRIYYYNQHSFSISSSK